jgi:serine/threonine protein phosphatase PrpC
VNWRFAGLQDVGERDEQQDAFGFSTNSDSSFNRHAGLAGVVADGVGGLQHGSVAARTAVGTFLSVYQSKSARETVGAAMQRAIAESHAAVSQVAQKAGGGQAAATLVAAVIREMELFWIWSGDSRAYLLRDRRLFQLTLDHNVGNMIDDNIARGGAGPSAVDEGRREVLTGCLGMPGELKFSASQSLFSLKAGDLVLLCTDGLYRTLSESKIAAILGAPEIEAGKPEAVGIRDQVTETDRCKKLLRAVRQVNSEGQDNVTVVTMGPVWAEIDAGQAGPGAGPRSRWQIRRLLPFLGKG